MVGMGLKQASRMGWVIGLAVVLGLVLFSAAWAAGAPADKKGASTWWEKLGFGADAVAGAADQSTAPAEDLIPYDWLKQQAGQRLVRPAQQAWGRCQTPSPVPIRALPLQQVRGPAGRRPQPHQCRRAAAPPQHLLGHRQRPRQPGSDRRRRRGHRRLAGPQAAAPGHLTEIAAPIIKKQMDASAHTGKLKMLDTVQTLQHLIDCQRGGMSAGTAPRPTP
jgi:hypothetical protein